MSWISSTVRRVGAATAVLAASSVAVGAQETRPLEAPPQFAIDQWTTEHGLPQNSVNAIVQGADGYLWIGTFGGLARFDGARFSLVERSDSAGRHVDRILSLALAADGGMWIGTENGLLFLQDGVWQVYTTADGLPDDEIRALHVDAAGVVWIGTGRAGLAWFDGSSFRSLGAVDGSTLGHVSTIVPDAEGRIWINTSGRVLAIPKGDVAAAYWWGSAADRPGAMLLQDRARAHWFDLPAGATRVSGDTLRRFGVAGGSIMVEDPAGGYWLGTINDGVFFLEVDGDSMRAQRYPLPDGRLAFRVRSMHVDGEGNVWLGTNAVGLLRARRNLFTTYTSEHGLSHDVGTAVFADASGTMWLGTNCGGVNAIDAERRTVRIFNPRSPGDPEGDPCVFAIAQGPDGTVWQGSYGNGVSALTSRGGQRRSIAGLPDTEVLALFTASDGTMWVGMRNGGLAAVEDGRVRATYTMADGLAHNGVRTIYETRDGALWIGTIEGLSRFSGGRFTSYTGADGLSAEHVRSIHEDRDGTLWIGTYGGGLNRFADGAFSAITRQDGLGDDVVSSILRDDADNFWMSGNRGIYRVARSQLTALAEGRIDRVHSVLYGRADGLRNPETNGGFQPAGWKDRRGHLWFPTVDGVAVVDPARALVNDRGPAAAVEEVIVNGVSRAPDEVVAVGPGRSNIEFRYAGLSLAAPEHVSYRYRLEGFDDEWVDAGTRRVAYYPRLPAGTYNFMVRAANRDGVWGVASAGLRLRVVPPLWSTWWFRMGAALTLLGLVAAVMVRREVHTRNARSAQVEFSRRLIESQEHERSRLAGELHDGLGQELLIARNRALLALRADSIDVIRDQLHQINSLVTGSLASIRELAHNLTPHQLEHLGISSALETMIDAVAETSGIELDSTIEHIDGLLPEEREINLYRIVQEALNNVVRHSETRTATVHVRREGALVRVTIADAGRGFRMNHDGGGPSGFGLSGMVERASILDGTLEIHSAPGRGVRIELSVPLTRAPAQAPAVEVREAEA